MPQIELFAIENPCVGICAMNTKGCCIGCLRKRAERQAWHSLSNTDKRKILSLLAHRQKRLIEHRTSSTVDQAEQFELL